MHVRIPFLSPLDTFLIAFVIYAQWRILRLLAGWAARRGVRRRWVAAAIALYAALFAGGVALGFPQVPLPYHPPRKIGEIVGAVVHMWAYCSMAAYVLYAGSRMLSRRLAPEFDPARRRLVNAATGALVAAPFGAIGYGALVGRTNFHVREVEVPIQNLPAALEGLRLALLSDIHLSAFLSERELERVIDAANEARPHVAMVTGDMISARGDPLHACLRQLARLRAEAGTFGCMGNHENYAGALGYATREGARLGISFLRGQARELRFSGAALNLVGVDYQPISKTGDYLRGVEMLAAPGAVNVLLSHNPDVFPAAASKGFDLTVSGHTHGGQVTVEILEQTLNPARFITPYVYGLYRDGKASAYVTSGIGTIGIPARLGARPEIALLRLKKARG